MGYYSPWVVNERVTLSAKNVTQKSKSLDLPMDPPHLNLCWVIPQLSHNQNFKILPDTELHSLWEHKLFSLRSTFHQPHKHNFHSMHYPFRIPQYNSPHKCLCILCPCILVMYLVPREKTSGQHIIWFPEVSYRQLVSRADKNF